MEIFKNKLIACIAALCVFTSGISVLPAEAVEAAVKQVNAPGEAVRDGKYIYYAYEMHSIRMGIMPYDTKKKKTVRTPAAHLTGTILTAFTVFHLLSFLDSSRISWDERSLTHHFADTQTLRIGVSGNFLLSDFSISL